MLTEEGQAYLKTAVYLLEAERVEKKIEDYQIEDYLQAEASNIDENARAAIAQCLAREIENPEQLQKDLFSRGWIKEKII